MSFIEAWLCLNIISIAARQYYPAFKLYKKLYINLSMDPDAKIYFLILLQVNICSLQNM